MPIRLVVKDDVVEEEASASTGRTFRALADIKLVQKRDDRAHIRAIITGFRTCPTVTIIDWGIACAIRSMNIYKEFHKQSQLCLALDHIS